MEELGDSSLDYHWRPLVVALVALTAAYGAIAFVAHFTGHFHVRVCFEGLSAGLLVWLSFWIWLAESSSRKVLASLIGIVTVVLASRFVLGDLFAAWFETSIWYVPITSMGAAVFRTLGLRFGHEPTCDGGQTYSIRSMMIGTTAIAVSFPVVAGLVEFRSDEDARTMLWLVDALVWVVPVSALCVGIIVSFLSNKFFYTATLLIASPVVGFAVCRVYGWNHYQSVVGVVVTAAVLAAIISWCLKRAGIAIVNRKDEARLAECASRSLQSR